jgi:hypothetical protein
MGLCLAKLPEDLRTVDLPFRQQDPGEPTTVNSKRAPLERMGHAYARKEVTVTISLVSKM